MPIGLQAGLVAKFVNWLCARRVPKPSDLTVGGMPHMDEAFHKILDSLADKKPRSRLEPYRELIVELRRRGRTYRDIAAILADRCQVPVAHSTIYAYLKVRGGARNAGQPVRPADSKPNADELRQRIAELKSSRPPVEPDASRFEFDAAEPLRIKATGSRPAGK